MPFPQTKYGVSPGKQLKGEFETNKWKGITFELSTVIVNVISDMKDIYLRP